MKNAIMLNVIMPNVIMTNVIMPNVIIPNIIFQIAPLLSVIMLNFMAPHQQHNSVRILVENEDAAKK